ncbi:MAG: MBL fold metallo-hydrolase [Clostridia bacterium]|nr:MBL fold metallo-hydrolase [Clostridia bacterium]
MTEIIQFGTLFSSSKGNCSLFRLGKTVILIDAGRSAKYIADALLSCGITPDQVSAVFVTHPHIDHVGALKVWTKKFGTTVHAAGETAEDLEDICAPGTVVRHPILFSVDVGGVRVTSFATSHDTRCSVGYRITVKDGEEAGMSFGVCTDLGIVTGSVERGLGGCLGIILESNHDVEMLKSGPYLPDQKQRILSDRGHLSNDTAAHFAAKLAKNGTRAFLLAHLSPVNNTPETAKNCFENVMNAEGVFPEMKIASCDSPVMFDITDLNTVNEYFHTAVTE